MPFTQLPVEIFMRYYRHLGTRVTLYVLASLAATMVAPMVARFLGPELTGLVDVASVNAVLTILASSMLAVSTFSLSIMVAEHRAAAEATTPRVHRLLLEDTTTQSVLATFIGAFVFALTAFILGKAGIYRDAEAIVVLAITVLVVGLVITAMLRWINHLSTLGSVDDSLRKVQQRTQHALKALAKTPSHGAKPLLKDMNIPQGAPITANCSGFVQLIDVAGIEDCLNDGAEAFVVKAPGDHVLIGEPVAYLSANHALDATKRVASHFLIGQQRTFEQDATLGLQVFAEIACKALSPGVNDAGTAIDTILVSKTVLWEFAEQTKTSAAQSQASNVYVPLVGPSDLLKAAFAPVARDGAAVIEVATQLRSAFADLAKSSNAEMRRAAKDMAEEALAYSQDEGLLTHELARLQVIAIGD